MIRVAKVQIGKTYRFDEEHTRDAILGKVIGIDYNRRKFIIEAIRLDENGQVPTNFKPETIEMELMEDEVAEIRNVWKAGISQEVAADFIIGSPEKKDAPRTGIIQASH